MARQGGCAAPASLAGGLGFKELPRPFPCERPRAQGTPKWCSGLAPSLPDPTFCSLLAFPSIPRCEPSMTLPWASAPGELLAHPRATPGSCRDSCHGRPLSFLLPVTLGGKPDPQGCPHGTQVQRGEVMCQRGSKTQPSPDSPPLAFPDTSGGPWRTGLCTVTVKSETTQLVLLGKEL